MLRHLVRQAAFCAIGWLLTSGVCLMSYASLQIQLWHLGPLALTQRPGGCSRDLHLSRAVAKIDQKNVSPETVGAVDVLNVNNPFRDALFKHSRLDLGVQALKDQGLVGLEVCQE